jgi:hypothetical protein
MPSDPPTGATDDAMVRTVEVWLPGPQSGQAASLFSDRTAMY